MRERAKRYGVRRVPAVVVDGILALAECCKDQGVTEAALRQSGLARVNPKPHQVRRDFLGASETHPLCCLLTTK